MTARLDLASAADENCLTDTIATLVRGGTNRLFGGIYADGHHASGSALLHADAARRLALEAGRAGTRLDDCVLVSAGRWWSYPCDERSCCPGEGIPMLTGPTLFQVEATYTGMTALPDRQSLEELFTPEPDQADLGGHVARHEETELIAALDGGRSSHNRSVIRSLFAAHRAAQAGAFPSDVPAARYGVALRSYAVRDSLWIGCDDGRLDGLELWVNLARRLPSPYDAAPLFLAGWTAYRKGNGALAGIAVDRALASDPDYSAARLLLGALAGGVDPRGLPKLRPATQGRAQTD